jgi:periplasmic divalent cation tolerance protein
MRKSKYVVVFVACASKREAERISSRLLNEKLIACANIIEGVKSSFWWKGKLDKAIEVLIVMKTVRKNFMKIQKRVKELHSYEVPEIVAVPIVEGESGYLKWIDESTK